MVFGLIEYGIINHGVMKIMYSGDHAGHAVVEFAGQTRRNIGGEIHFFALDGMMQVMRRIIEGVVIVGFDTGNGFAKAGDVANTGNERMHIGTEVPYDDLGFILSNYRS